MPVEFKLYLKKSVPIEAQFITDLEMEINLVLPEGTNIEIIDTKNRVPEIDWRWRQNGASHPMVNGMFLAVVVDDRIIPQHSGSLERLPTKEIILNWMKNGPTDFERYKGEPPNWHEQRLFDVSERWVRREEEYVYHYTSWDVARDFILSSNQCIKLNPILFMNDPLEFSRINMPLYGVLNKKELPIRMFNAIHASSKSGVRLFCATQDISADMVYPQQLLRRSAVRGFSHAPMWNHYAVRHEGVCIILNKVVLDKAIRSSLGTKGTIMQQAINYQKDRSDLSKVGGLFNSKEGMEDWSKEQLEKYTRDVIFENPEPFFFKKNIDWSYENEDRWIYVGEGEEPVYVPIKDALEGFIVGCDFDVKQNAEANALAAENNIPHKRIWWNNGIASPPWDLEAFEEGDTLETWEKEAHTRRVARRKT